MPQSSTGEDNGLFRSHPHRRIGVPTTACSSQWRQLEAMIPCEDSIAALQLILICKVLWQQMFQNLQHATVSGDANGVLYSAFGQAASTRT
ncbi:unnamed protein product [Urochloa humidicola]